ncbi:MAG TPA: potassium/proton antiporter [Nakamurella sp.]|nr:potassium/proton antiporter [Nakamurella sp.]
MSALILILAVIAVRISRRFGLPTLLLYLGIGMLFGNAGFGIDFSNTLLTEHLGLAALVFILTEGGLTTRWANVRPALGLGVAMATVSVVVSIAVAAVGVHLLLGLDWRVSLTWGAVLSSTDVAAVFSVLRGVGVRPKLAAALELESGLNDAPVVIAVLLFAGGSAIHWTDPLLVVYELIAGAAIGLALGFAGSWWLRRGSLPATGLYPLAAIAVASGAYAGAQFAHASGFLATYLAALVLGNSELPQRASTLSFAEGLGWVAQIGLFVLLGLYVDPTKLPAALVPGVIIGLMVLLVARPLSVIAAALPFRLPWREQAFLSYSGLRGAVPIVLALIPLSVGQPHSAELVAVIVVAVVIYTLLQGTTLPMVARALRVVDNGTATEVHIDVAPLDEMKAHVLQVRVPDGSRLHGVYLTQLRLPEGAVVALLMRQGAPLQTDRTTRLQSGDQLLIVTPERVRTATERRLRAVARGGALARWFGEGGEPTRG